MLPDIESTIKNNKKTIFVLNSPDDARSFYLEAQKRDGLGERLSLVAPGVIWPENFDAVITDELTLNASYTMHALNPTLSIRHFSEYYVLRIESGGHVAKDKFPWLKPAVGDEVMTTEDRKVFLTVCNWVKDNWGNVDDLKNSDIENFNNKVVSQILKDRNYFMESVLQQQAAAAHHAIFKLKKGFDYFVLPSGIINKSGASLRFENPWIYACLMMINGVEPKLSEFRPSTNIDLIGPRCNEWDSVVPTKNITIKQIYDFLKKSTIHHSRDLHSTEMNKVINAAGDSLVAIVVDSEEQKKQFKGASGISVYTYSELVFMDEIKRQEMFLVFMFPPKGLGHWRWFLSTFEKDFSRGTVYALFHSGDFPGNDELGDLRIDMVTMLALSGSPRAKRKARKKISKNLFNSYSLSLALDDKQKVISSLESKLIEEIDLLSRTEAKVVSAPFALLKSETIKGQPPSLLKAVALDIWWKERFPYSQSSITEGLRVSLGGASDNNYKRFLKRSLQCLI
jgi:hypothetical protein